MGKGDKKIEWKVPPENAGRTAEILLDKSARDDIRHVALLHGMWMMLNQLQRALKEFNAKNNEERTKFEVAVDERIASYEALMDIARWQVNLKGIDVLTMADAIENEIISHFGLNKEGAEELE